MPAAHYDNGKKKTKTFAFAAEAAVSIFFRLLCFLLFFGTPSGSLPLALGHGTGRGGIRTPKLVIFLLSCGAVQTVKVWKHSESL